MPRPADDEPLVLRTRDAVQIEALVSAPEVARGLALGCHPHPLFGGTMQNKVIHSFTKACRDAGFLSLRFNFRGAGRSGGVHGHGVDEVHDVHAAAAALFARGEGIVGPRVIGGFSFGSHVGLRAAITEPRFTHRLGIGLPLSREYDFSFLGEDQRPLFLLAGSEDVFCPPAELSALGQRLRAAGVPVEVTIVPGASHFFDRLGHVLRQELDRIALRLLGEAPEARRYDAAQDGDALL